MLLLVGGYYFDTSFMMLFFRRPSTRFYCHIVWVAMVVLHCSSTYPTGTPRRIDVDSIWILRPYVEDQISTNFHVGFTYFFDVISLIEKSTSFPHIFFDVIWMAEKSTLFPRTSFVKISTVSLLIFFDVILMVK